MGQHSKRLRRVALRRQSVMSVEQERLFRGTCSEVGNAAMGGKCFDASACGRRCLDHGRAGEERRGRTPLTPVRPCLLVFSSLGVRFGGLQAAPQIGFHAGSTGTGELCV